MLWVERYLNSWNNITGKVKCEKATESGQSILSDTLDLVPAEDKDLEVLQPLEGPGGVLYGMWELVKI